MKKITDDHIALEPISNANISAQITPECGANLVSFKVGDIELIHWAGRAPEADDDWTGAFPMFPTPCRLANSSYDFEGKHITQKKHGEDVFIHGLIRDEIMQYKNDGDNITSWIDITPDHPVYEGFPFACTFTTTHALNGNTLTVSFKVENKDNCNIPFGYGIHPYWRIQGERKDVSVRIPCDSTLDLENLVPTGGSSPVEGTDLDLRTLSNIENLFIDNAFLVRKPGDAAEIVFSAIGKRLVINASDNFPHMIVYAPEGESFLCVENLTTCPNAPNLVSDGKGDIATMLTVAPGETVEGWIKYTIEDV